MPLWIIHNTSSDRAGISENQIHDVA